MRLSPESIARKSLQKMLYDRLSIVLRSQPEPKASDPTSKVIRELSKELTNRLLGNPQFLEAVGLIGELQTVSRLRLNRS